MRPRRKTLTLALLFAAVVAAPAIAQQPASSYPPACDASKMSKSDVERAHTVFLSGKQYLEESNYEKAISYFKDAYSIDCSIHAILPIIATAYERKGDRGEAVHALEEYQKRAPAAPDHEVIERRIRNLKDQMARDQPPPAASSSAPPATTASTPPAPSSTPAATASGVAPSSATGGSTGSAPAGEGGHTVAPWIVAGAGAAAIIAGAIVYVPGAGEVSTAESHCPGHKCPVGDTSDQSSGNDGRTLETVGVVVMSVGAAAVAAGLVWHFLEPTGAAASSATATRVVPVLATGVGGSPSFTGLSVSGAF